MRGRLALIRLIKFIYERLTLEHSNNIPLSEGYLSFLLEINEPVKAFNFVTFFLRNRNRFLISGRSLLHRLFILSIRKRCQTILGVLNITANRTWNVQSIEEALSFHSLVDNITMKVDNFSKELSNFYLSIIEKKQSQADMLRTIERLCELKAVIETTSKASFMQLKQSFQALAALMAFRQQMLFQTRGVFEYGPLTLD